MVGYQAISPDLRSGASVALGKKVEVKRVVAILKKRSFTPVAPLDDARRMAVNDDARQAYQRLRSILIGD